MPMTTTVQVRHSADDRKGSPRTSPFRSKDESTRLKGAYDMVLKRTHEVYALEALIAQTTNTGEKRRLGTRLLATKNNLRSWQDYIDQHTPREPRAVITPAA